MLKRSRFVARKPARAGRPAWKVAEEFRRWLRKLPCAACEAVATPTNPIVAAHVDHAGSKGTSTKVADKDSLPLCDACHRRQHSIGWLSFEKTLPLGDAVALSTIYWTEWPGRFAWERDQSAATRAQA